MISPLALLVLPLSFFFLLFYFLFPFFFAILFLIAPAVPLSPRPPLPLLLFSLIQKGNHALLSSLDVLGRTAEMARLYGMDFFSVLSRGSQYRVECMLVRLTKPLNFLHFSPSKEDVGSQIHLFLRFSSLTSLLHSRSSLSLTFSLFPPLTSFIFAFLLVTFVPPLPFSSLPSVSKST